MNNKLRLLFITLLLNACSFGVPVTSNHYKPSINKAPTKARKVSSSYIVRGKKYSVLASADGFVQQGIASWYGKKFHGRKTSNGETYNMFAMTAAHKNLPLPTELKVTHLGTGKHIIVKVNDRGPFVEGRIIDLSYGAAKKLGIIKHGTAKVKIESTTKSTRSVRPIPLKSSSPESELIFVQLAAFKHELNAKQYLQDATDKGVKYLKIYPKKIDGTYFYRVRTGPYYPFEKAQSIHKKLLAKSYHKAKIVIENK